MPCMQPFLFMRRKTHEEKVSHFVALGERKSRSIEALEDELRVVAPSQGDTDNL